MTALDWERARRVEAQPKPFDPRWRKHRNEWCVETHRDVSPLPGECVMVSSRRGATEVRVSELVMETVNSFLWRVRSVTTGQ